MKRREFLMKGSAGARGIALLAGIRHIDEKKKVVFSLVKQ